MDRDPGGGRRGGTNPYLVGLYLGLTWAVLTQPIELLACLGCLGLLLLIVVFVIGSAVLGALEWWHLLGVLASLALVLVLEQQQQTPGGLSGLLGKASRWRPDRRSTRR
jgi:peptidoglycan/LPS O-acetylase OafA/YrhL